jgi:aspartate aminotransferase
LKFLSRVVDKTEASQTLALTALAKKLHAEGVDVVTLTAGEPDFPTPFHVKDSVVTVNGFSKAYSMTGWRIGFLGARQDIVTNAEKVQGQVTSNASSISQYAALAALAGPEDELRKMAAEFQRRRDFIHGEVTSIEGISCIKPKGAFYVFPNVSAYYGGTFKGKKTESGDDIARFLLDEERVVVVPGSGFGAMDHVRISYACSMTELEKAAERLKRGFKKLV